MIMFTSILSLIGTTFLSCTSGIGGSNAIFDSETMYGYEFSVLRDYYFNARNNTVENNNVTYYVSPAIDYGRPYAYTSCDEGFDEEAINEYPNQYFVSKFGYIDDHTNYYVNFSYNTARVGRIGHNINLQLKLNGTYDGTTDTYLQSLELTRNATYDYCNVTLDLTTFFVANVETPNLNGESFVYPFLSTFRTYTFDLSTRLEPINTSYIQQNVLKDARFNEPYVSSIPQYLTLPSDSYIASNEDCYTAYFLTVHVNKLSQATEDAYETGYNDGYDTGYETGIAIGSQTSSTSFQQLLGTIIDTPILYLRKFFGYEVFGVNIYHALATLMSLLVALAVFRLVRGIV